MANQKIKIKSFKLTKDIKEEDRFECNYILDVKHQYFDRKQFGGQTYREWGWSLFKGVGMSASYRKTFGLKRKKAEKSVEVLLSKCFDTTKKLMVIIRIGKYSRAQSEIYSLKQHIKTAMLLYNTYNRIIFYN